MKRKIFTILCAAVLICYGCENDFDPKIYGTLNTSNYPSTAAEYESFMMLCYTPFCTPIYYLGAGSTGNQLTWYNPAGGVFRLFDAPSDVMAVWNYGWGDGWYYMSQASFSNWVYAARQPLNDPNINHFPKAAEVTYMTYVIGVIEKAAENVLPDTKKRELLGEAHLCRGIMTYYLLHLYGPVPLIMNPDDVTNQEKLEDVIRPSLQQMTEWISADFDYAYNNITETQTVKGRYNRDYARVCLMRHCLNEGSYMPGYYQRALDMYEELKGKYSLFIQGANPYAELFKTANEWNREIIMAVSCNENSDNERTHGNANSFEQYAVPDNAARVDDQGDHSPFYLQGAGWGQVFNVSKNFYDTFDAADKRRECIITSYYTTGGVWIDRNTTNWDGFIINKYPVETPTTYQGTDIPLARWADVLLMYAEAEVRKTNAAPSVEAVAAVNEVRNRAGLGDLPAAAIASKDAFFDALLTERGHELWYEGVRKIDLIRFNKYAQYTFQSKGVRPTHQYIPLPNYVIEEAESYGKVLTQTYERDGWQADLAAAH
jgi:hypothetical protein